MSKLFNLKNWLTLPDAARHLSIMFGEDVTEADILRLALDGNLRLSVYFVNDVKARCGMVVPWEETDWRLIPNLDNLLEGGVATADHPTFEDCRPYPYKLEALYSQIPVDERSKYYPLMRNLVLDGERFLTLFKGITTLRELWDLPMIGNERQDIEHAYQNLTGGPAVTLACLDGTFVEGSDGKICQLQEHFDQNEYQSGSSAQLGRLKQHIAENGIASEEAELRLNLHKEKRKDFLEKRIAQSEEANYYPAGGLPSDAVIVVRTEAIRQFEQSLNGAPKQAEKPLGTRERNSLLTIIAVLCEYSAIKPQERGAANQIAKLAEEIGVELSDDTVRRVLARIPDALGTRIK